MIEDEQVKRLREAVTSGVPLYVAAARAGMSETTARRWRRGLLPSQTKQPRGWRTRTDPFESVWPRVREELEADPELEVIALFEDLQNAHPGRFGEGQLRTLQRRVRAWRAVSGPEREVIFRQVYRPGHQAQSDFTCMNDLAVTIAGELFAHKLFHFQLCYSKWEDATLAFSETWEAFSLGVQNALWNLGAAPEEQRTDNLSAATHRLGDGEERAFTDRYQALLDHYHLKGSRITPGRAHENGVVEQGNYRLKRAIDRELRRRKSRDFANRDEYEAFIAKVIGKRNSARQSRISEERAQLQPLPARRLDDWRDVAATVGAGSVIRVDRNTYSVSSRLIGHEVTVRVHADLLEVRHGQAVVARMERLRGHNQSRIDYRHVIRSLVRKPGAFARYQFRDEMFPRLVFRKAYDELGKQVPGRADLEYLQILHVAAQTSECDVAAALELLLAAGRRPDLTAVKDVIAVETPSAPDVHVRQPDLGSYDALLLRRTA